MEKKIKYCEINKLECVLKCTDSKVFYKFPADDDLFKIWQEKVGLDDLARDKPVPRICNNHFSSDMIKLDGKNLKPHAVPNCNLPDTAHHRTPCRKVPDLIQSKPEIFQTNTPSQKVADNIQSKPKIVHINVPMKKVIIQSKPKILQTNTPIKNVSSVVQSGPKIDKMNSQIKNVVESEHRTVQARNPIVQSEPKSVETIDLTETNIIQSKPKILHLFDKNTKSQNTSIEKSLSNRANIRSTNQTNMTSLPVAATSKSAVVTTPKSTIATPKKPPQNNKPIPNYRIADHPVQTDEIITSRNSKCFLKCKDAHHTYQFPKDEKSRKIWAKRLGLAAMPLRSSTARICRNHFSLRMFTVNKGLRLTRCAIPDMNLPGKTLFVSEEGKEIQPRGVPLGSDEESIDGTMEKPNPSPLPDKMQEYFRAILDPPFPIEDHPEISQKEILINPIENLKTAVNQERNKEGFLHVYRPGVEKWPDDENKVSVPDNVEEGFAECVLKCTNSEHLFKFPSLEFQRKIWLERVGLTHCYFNTMICDKHFSDQMFSKPRKKLIKNAYPDINIPSKEHSLPKDPPKKLSDYRLVLPDHVCDVIELPEYICVLTVLKQHTEVDAPINGMKYIKHSIDMTIPKREREIQVRASDLVGAVNVGIMADDGVEDSDTEDDIACQNKGWVNIFETEMSKTEMFECLICGEISVGYNSKLKHSNMHKETSSLCFQCGRLFPSQIKLKIHESKKHFNQMRKALRCPKIHCKKAFHSKKQLLNHVEEHTTRPEHECGKCKRVFISALKLYSHQIICKNIWPKKQKRLPIKRKRNFKCL